MSSYSMELKACERQAERGDVHAQVRLGQMYEMGEGVSADREKAVFWYQKAAEQGSIPAKQRLEQLVVSENPNETPIEVAFREWKGWMNRSKNTAESAPDPVLTTPEEQFSYAVRLYYGKNAAVNKEKALFFYEQAAVQGHLQAQLCCAMMYNNGDGTIMNKTQAYYWYEQAAKQGAAFAQCVCGRMSENGIGVAVSWKQAEYWYDLAAKQGNTGAAESLTVLRRRMQLETERLMEANAPKTPDTQFAYALQYQTGNGVVRNPVKAAYWYEKAARQGHLKAQACLGGMYERGEGVQQDRAQAVYWYELAAKRGSDFAQCLLGRLFEAGLDQERVRAAYWYQKAAAQGNPLAQQKLAQLNEEMKAEERQCAEPTDACGQYQLGLRLYYGDPPEKEKALEWFTAAAKQRDADAQYFCGLMYYYGDGISADKRQALRYLELAAAQGHQKAALFVKQMLDRGEGAYPDGATFWL